MRRVALADGTKERIPHEKIILLSILQDIYSLDKISAIMFGFEDFFSCFKVFIFNFFF